MVTNEIITLQFGHYSNFIGAHWWNLQESSFSYDADAPSEINHDVLFREGLNYSREVTFTPRLLLVDLKGSLGTLSIRSDLYEEKSIPDVVEDTVLWSTDKVQVEQAPKCEKNEFLNDIEQEDMKMIDGEASSIDKLIQRYELDDKVHYWSDYLSTRFHPRSFSIINQYAHNATDAFNSFGQGVEVWKSELFSEEWIDKCRVYAEECDYLQGFQVLCDNVDGFSGLCCSALSYLQDEYSNKSIFAIPTQPAWYPDDTYLSQSLRIVNSVFTFGELIESSTAFVPLSLTANGWGEPSAARSFPHLRYDKTLSYHSSAILAAYLEAVTSGYRQRKGASQLSSILSNLTPCGRKLLSGSLRLPFPIYPEVSIMESLETLNDSFWTTVTPVAEVSLDSSPLQEIFLRGLSSFSMLPSAKKRNTSPAYQFQSIEEMFQNFLNFCTSGSEVQAKINNLKLPLKIPASYPNIFDDSVTRIGCISEMPLTLKFPVTETPTFAGLHNCSTVSNLLNSLSYKAKMVNLNQLRCFSATGLEKLEYLESIEKLLTLNDNYC